MDMGTTKDIKKYYKVDITGRGVDVDRYGLG
jgi:hypothetical protein